MVIGYFITIFLSLMLNPSSWTINIHKRIIEKRVKPFALHFRNDLCWKVETRLLLQSHTCDFFIFEVDIGKFLFNSLQKPSFILKNLTLLRRRTAGRGDVEAIKIVRFDDKVMSSLHFMYAKKEELLPLRCA